MTIAELQCCIIRPRKFERVQFGKGSRFLQLFPWLGNSCPKFNPNCILAKQHIQQLGNLGEWFCNWAQLFLNHSRPGSCYHGSVSLNCFAKGREVRTRKTPFLHKNWISFQLFTSSSIINLYEMIQNC